ncbi:Cerebroside-sulfatase [Puteibacter caeruleilacunae]|nr:Cerebroside-sulfatase [Puteibacter caeruleilacunae]
MIIILADDLGFGDVHLLNNTSKIPTPHLDQMGKDGMIFTDAHSGSAVCTPTRYGVLTGRYCWRTWKKRGVLNGYDRHLIDPDRSTVADVFKSAGYATGCIGKWHLGMDMPFKHDRPDRPKGEAYLDVSQAIDNGPTENGFDYYYGISASLDFPPYQFIENDHFVGASDRIFDASGFPMYRRKGEGNADFVHTDCLDVLTAKAKAFIDEHQEDPFFLYFPLTAPHKPVAPHPRFRGLSKMGHYGDFVMQVDWTVGQILDQLKQLNIDENTMVILTSDNASFMYQVDRTDKYDHCHVADSSMQAFDVKNHRSNYQFRGTKADIWEGGHRVPFMVKWPKGVKTATRCDETICLTDFYATFCELLNLNHDRNAAGEDSFSFLPLLQGHEKMREEPVINHSSGGMFAIRNKDWKLVLGNGSGGREAPRGNAFAGPYQLYNLSTDISESVNVYDENTNVVEEMLKTFDLIFERTETKVKHKNIE